MMCSIPDSPSHWSSPISLTPTASLPGNKMAARVQSMLSGNGGVITPSLSSLLNLSGGTKVYKWTSTGYVIFSGMMDDLEVFSDWCRMMWNCTVSRVGGTGGVWPIGTMQS